MPRFSKIIPAGMLTVYGNICSDIRNNFWIKSIFFVCEMFGCFLCLRVLLTYGNFLFKVWPTEHAQFHLLIQDVRWVVLLPTITMPMPTALKRSSRWSTAIRKFLLRDPLGLPRSVWRKKENGRRLETQIAEGEQNRLIITNLRGVRFNIFLWINYFIGKYSLQILISMICEKNVLSVFYSQLLHITYSEQRLD